MDLPQAKESGRAATCLRALWASRGAEAAPASVRSCVLAAGAARHGQHPPAGGCSLKPMLVPAAAATRLLGQRLDFALQLCYVGGIWPCNRKRAPGQRHRQAAACVTAPAPPHINATLHAAVAMRLESVQDVCSNRNLPARYEFSSFTSASLRGLYCLPSIVSIFVVIRRKLPKQNCLEGLPKVAEVHPATSVSLAVQNGAEAEPCLCRDATHVPLFLSCRTGIKCISKITDALLSGLQLNNCIESRAVCFVRA